MPEPGGWALMASVRSRADGAAAVLSPALVARHDVALRVHGVAWEGLTALSGNIWPGCAGAPVLDLEGRLAGVILGVSCAAGEPARGAEVLVLPLKKADAPRLAGVLQEILRPSSLICRSTGGMIRS